MIAEPFVEYDAESRVEYFTPAGWDLVDAARTVASQGARYLDDVLARSTMEPDVDLLTEAQQLLAVATCALDGLNRESHAPEGLRAPWIATGLRDMLSAVLARIVARKPCAEPAASPTRPSRSGRPSKGSH